MSGLDSRFQLCFPLQEAFLDKDTGLPLAAGIISFFKDSSRSTPKAVYTISGSYPNYTYVELPNPLTLSSIGTFEDEDGNDIVPYLFSYDGTPATTTGTIENYYITVQNSEGTAQFSRQAWPNSSSSSVASSNPNYNYVRNGTFFAWDNGTSFAGIGAGSRSLTDFVLNDWTYDQDDTSQTINISQGTFTAGQTTVPGNPPYYFIYECTGVGSGVQTINRLRQTYQNVQTLSGKSVALDLWVNQETGGSGSSLTAIVTQDFGGGGSTSVQTSATISSGITVGSWQQYFVTFAIPSITGKTVGTNSQLILAINLPLNKVCKIDIENIRLRESTTLSDFQQISNDDNKRNTNALTLYPPFTTGDVKFTYKATADVGWVLANDSTIGKTNASTNWGPSYFNLYKLLYANVSDSYCPVSGGRTGNSTNDWNSGKTLRLSLALGRALGVAGAGASLTSRALGENVSLAETVTLDVTQMPAHAHTGTAAVKGDAAGGSPAFITFGADTQGITQNAVVTLANTGGGLPHNNMQPSAFLNLMIKL